MLFIDVLKEMDVVMILMIVIIETRKKMTDIPVFPKSTV